MKTRHLLSLLLLIGRFAFSADTAAVRQDTIVHLRPITEIGSIEPFGDSSTFITKKNIIWKEYRSVYDLLAGEHGIFIRDLASPGQKNQIVINGMDDGNIGIMVDGVPYNDEFAASFNLWNIPVDMIERIEIVTGPHAVFYDGGSSGGIINIVTKSFTNNRAVTNLRYSQGVDGYVQTDAMFAQNIFRGFNLSFGLSHHGYGTNKETSNFRGRFYNSNDDAWGFRAKARYDLTNYLNVSFFHLSNKTWTGLHGGVNYSTSSSLFDGYQAEVENLDSYEKLFYSQSFLTVAVAPSEDSSNVFTLTGYYFDRIREYRDEENRLNTNGIFLQQNFYSISKGIKAQYSVLSSINRLLLTYHYKETGPGFVDTWESIGIKDQLTLFDIVDLTGFAVSSPAISYGGEGSVLLLKYLSLYGGYSYNAGETTASRTIFPADETVESFETGIRLNVPGAFEGKISMTRRIIDNPVTVDTVVTGNGYFRAAQFLFDGISISAHAQYGDFHLEGSALYLVQPTIVRENVSLSLYPDMTLNGSLYFHGLLAQGHLDLKAGIRGSFSSAQTGMKPFDTRGVWMPSSMLSYGPSGTMDLFAIGKIGDAYVHLIWENVTGNQYLLAPVYPLYERNIRFGVSWEFLN